MGYQLSVPGVEPFVFLTEGVVELARALSTSAPVAYCEADLFGGTGTQASMVWRDGSVVLGPIVREDDERERPLAEQRPINAEWLTERDRA